MALAQRQTYWSKELNWRSRHKFILMDTWGFDKETETYTLKNVASSTNGQTGSMLVEEYKYFHI